MFARVLSVLVILVSTGTAAVSDDADKARAMLERVATELKKDQTGAIQTFTKGEHGFRDGDIYPFCFRLSDGIVVTGQTAGSYTGEENQFHSAHWGTRLRGRLLSVVAPLVGFQLRRAVESRWRGAEFSLETTKLVTRDGRVIEARRGSIGRITSHRTAGPGFVLRGPLRPRPGETWGVLRVGSYQSVS
jgi:hypothetical protein